MIEMKYVVVSSKAGEQMFLLPRAINHKDFAEVLSYIKEGGSRDWKREHRLPISAGFTDGVMCYGSSETLTLKSRLEDTALLKAGGFRATKALA